MSAAVTAGHHGLKVLVVEKEPKFGGTTARSGGWLWIPGTSLARAWGIVEGPDTARTYLRHEAGNSFDAARVDAFLSNGPEAVDFFTGKTALAFDMPLTDRKSTRLNSSHMSISYAVFCLKKKKKKDHKRIQELRSSLISIKFDRFVVLKTSINPPPVRHNRYQRQSPHPHVTSTLAHAHPG